ncbi:MAG: type II secretory pathway, component PulD [Verrucomicrobiota bacterium]|nr:type II secretory pathway, component PulD [Verrucomicrobiota bacterium]
MKPLTSCLRSLVLALAIMGCIAKPTLLAATSPVTPKQKIELMAAALRARSDGDLETARKHLEALILLLPNDVNVQRLFASINEDIARTKTGPSAPEQYGPPLPNRRVSTQAEIDAAVEAESDAGRQAAIAARRSDQTTAIATVSTVLTASEPTESAEPVVNEEHKALAARGRAQFLAGDYKQARKTFAQLATLDPDNPDARNFLARIEALGSTSRDADRVNTKAQMLQEVEQGWQRPQVFNREAALPAQAQNTGLREHLAAVVIPRINFTGVPLSQVVETLSALSEEYDPARKGVNLVLINPPGNDPVVSITLRQLQLNRILDFIVESVGYEYDVQSDAVVIRQATGQGTRLETEFFPLSRSTIIRLTGISTSPGALAEQTNPLDVSSQTASSSSSSDETALKQFLQRAGVPFDTVSGASLALADGQLIVTQSARNLEKVRNILRRYSDIKQVEIESRFLEVQQGDLEELGFNWNVRSGGRQTFDSSGKPVFDNTGSPVLDYSRSFSNDANRSLSSAFGTPGAAGSRLIITQPNGAAPVTDPVAAPNISSGMDFAADAVTPFAKIGGVMGEFDVDMMIRALSRKQGNDLMSAPKVTVLSGKTAQIVVAQELRYPQSFSDIQAQVGRGESSSGSAGVAITAGTPQNFTTRNVGVEMEVTPSVEDDNSISLMLEPKVTEFEGYVEYGGASIAIASGTTVKVPSGFFQPLFSVRRVRTEVTIWDGATVVMGGLTREQSVSVKDKVPVLGDIPLLGRLFQSKGESSQKRNLLIFVTANLISPGGSPARQQLETVEPGALFQNPVIVTPGGSVSRDDESK